MSKMEEHDFTRKFCDAIGQASGWGYHTIRPNIAGLFKNSTRRSDALVLLEKYPPIVVECKFSSSSGTPVEDCRKYMGLECSYATGVHTGQKITLGIAVVYPDGADEWHSNPAYHRTISKTGSLTEVLFNTKHSDKSHQVTKLFGQAVLRQAGCKETYTILYHA